jgi:alpha-N-acetylglucosaminidase
MANLNRWAGPLPMSWVEQDRALQHRLLQRARSLGMIPVLPGFNGVVPKRMVELFPNVSYAQMRNWGHFDQRYTESYLLDITSQLARDLAKDYYTRYQKEYGTDHFYGMDTFNEMSPPNASSEYLRSYGRAVASMLKSSDSRAVWILQGWMFRNVSFWWEGRARALLKSIPLERALILDLASTTGPQYGRLKSYFGHPFVFCMLHNYGGTLGLYGKAATVNQEAYKARNEENEPRVASSLALLRLYCCLS